MDTAHAGKYLKYILLLFVFTFFSCIFVVAKANVIYYGTTTIDTEQDI